MAALKVMASGRKACCRILATRQVRPAFVIDMVTPAELYEALVVLAMGWNWAAFIAHSLLQDLLSPLDHILQLFIVGTLRTDSLARDVASLPARMGGLGLRSA